MIWGKCFITFNHICRLGFLSLQMVTKMTSTSQALVAHACNPSYSRGSDQEDSCLKPVGENSL
jgi:hypothetical protein